MTADLLLQACHAQAQLVDDLIEPWKREHPAAEQASAHEALFRKLVELCHIFQELDQAVWDDVWAGRIQDFQSRGEGLRRLWEDLLKILDKVSTGARALVAEGLPLAGLSEFDQAVEGIRRLRDRLNDRWPWIDSTMIEASRAAYAAGKSQEVKGILDELRRSRP
jgi:hypothetical protein